MKFKGNYQLVKKSIKSYPYFLIFDLQKEGKYGKILLNLREFEIRLFILKHLVKIAEQIWIEILYFSIF